MSLGLLTRMAFFYRRLNSLPATAHRFLLNHELPIPFAGRSRMEVDFYCEAARLVIELDGAQHLADADAYRRDREKDALLQEQGYFVLRFLAEDLARNLGTILDAVLRVLANRLSERCRH
jgi:very-short-patch-repair endonuclease